VKKPSVPRFLLLGLAAGCTLATKHSGVLVFPVLATLALVGVIRGPRPNAEAPMTAAAHITRGKQARQLAATLVGVGLIAGCALWSFYGFRFAARAHGQSMNPPLAEYAQQVTSPAEAKAILALARWQVLPEAYLYGLAGVRMIAHLSVW